MLFERSEILNVTHIYCDNILIPFAEAIGIYRDIITGLTLILENGIVEQVVNSAAGSDSLFFTTLNNSALVHYYNPRFQYKREPIDFDSESCIKVYYAPNFDQICRVNRYDRVIPCSENKNGEYYYDSHVIIDFLGTNGLLFAYSLVRRAILSYFNNSYTTITSVLDNKEYLVNCRSVDSKDSPLVPITLDCSVINFPEIKCHTKKELLTKKIYGYDLKGKVAQLNINIDDILDNNIGKRINNGLGKSKLGFIVARCGNKFVDVKYQTLTVECEIRQEEKHLGGIHRMRTIHAKTKGDNDKRVKDENLTEENIDAIVKIIHDGFPCLKTSSNKEKLLRIRNLVDQWHDCPQVLERIDLKLLI